MAACFVPADLCEDLLCCVICYEAFTETRVPKALPCLHTFCTDCLTNTIHAYKRSHYRRRGATTAHFPCPVCKDSIKIPANGTAGFRDDFRIRRMSEVLMRTGTLLKIEANSQQEKEDEKEEDVPELSLEGKMCEVCRFFNKESEAPVYCLECNKLLCRSCSEKHLKTSIAKGHNIVSASEALPSHTTCRLHGAEQLKYFCRTCSKPICMTCTLTDDHPDHDVTNLSEESAQIKNALDRLITSCQDKLPKMASHVVGFEKVEKRLRQKEQLTQKAILARTFEEITRAKNNQAKMEAELRAICNRKYKELTFQRESIEDDMRDMRDMCDFTRAMVDRGQDIQVVGARHEVSDKLQKMAASVTPSSPDVATFTHLEKYDALAEEEATKDEQEHPVTQSSILAEIKSVVAQMRLFSQGRLDLRVEPLRCIGRRGSADGEFNFPSAVAILQGGDIAVADMHNNRVQIFDSKGNFKRKFGHNGFKPCGIAATKDGNIAVTDCKTHINCIKVFTPEGQQKKQLGLGEFDYPFSIAINSKGQYIISDPAVSRITVLNQDGTVKVKFPTKSKFTFYLTVNSKDEILVSDWYNHHVKVFSQTGRLLRTIGSKGQDDGQLLIPLGIVCDRKDNVVILDCKCERVSMFGADGQFLSHLIGKSEGIEHSRAMALSHDGHLVITHGDNKRDIPNEIRVYQM